MSETFTVINDWGYAENHAKGDLACRECTCPVANRCPECGGVVHFYDYDEWWDEAEEDMLYRYSSACDGCGKSWYDVSDYMPRRLQ